MSFPQGSGAFNQAYFDSLNGRVKATVTCNGLQRIASQAVASVQATLSAVNTQLSQVTADYNQLATRITTLENHIATLVGSQNAFSALTVQAATVGQATTLAGVITYLGAQATVLGTLGTAGNASFVQQALKLAQELIQVQTAYTRLENQIQSFEALVADLPARLTTLEQNITAQAATITSCTITL